MRQRDPAELSAARQRAAAKELGRRQALPNAYAAYEATLLPWQRRMVQSTARRKVSPAGRRSGKTHGGGAAIINACIKYPGATIPVFERTSTCQAARVLWKFLQEANERFALGMRFHHSLLIATLPNRAEVAIMGADTAEAADKARGNKYPEAFVDEAGTFRPQILDYLLTDVLDAALLDYRGSLTMLGTPPPRFDDAHPFYRAVMQPDAGWEVHNATFRDNDTIPLNMPGASPEERLAAREAEFQAMLARNGWTEDTPRVRREWLGLFAHDDESLLYALRAANHQTNGVGIAHPDTSEGRWFYGLGIDFGYAPDPCAFVVVAWRAGDPRLWVLESYEQGHLIPSAVAAHVERLRSRYQFSFIIGDTGGAGKPYAEELKQRYAIPVEAARKRGKAAYIEMLNGDLASSTCLIVERTNADLIADLYTVRKGEDGLDDQRDHEATHLPDALRYTVTEVRGRQAGLGAADGPAPGSREYLARIEAEMERLQLEQYHHGRVPDELDSEALAVAMLTD